MQENYKKSSKAAKKAGIDVNTIVKNSWLGLRQ